MLGSMFKRTVMDPGSPLVAVPGHEFHFVLCPGLIDRKRSCMDARVVSQFGCNNCADRSHKYPQCDLGHGLSQTEMLILPTCARRVVAMTPADQTIPLFRSGSFSRSKTTGNTCKRSREGSHSPYKEANKPSQLLVEIVEEIRHRWAPQPLLAELHCATRIGFTRLVLPTPG